jgi:hypothetical protein
MWFRKCLLVFLANSLKLGLPLHNREVLLRTNYNVGSLNYFFYFEIPQIKNGLLDIKKQRQQFKS